jgi:hypothetical protein
MISFFGTRTIRFARERKRSIGNASGLAGSASSLTASLAVSSSLRRCAILADQLRVGQPLPSDRRTDLPKPFAIIMLALVEPEGLFIQIPAQMCRINTDVGSLQGPFQEAPEILDIVCVNVPTNKLDRVVNGFMRVSVRESEIRLQRVSVNVRARLDGRPNLWGKRSTLHIGDVRGLDPTGVILGATLDNAENGFLARSASALDFPFANVTVHVLGKAANEGFVGLDLAAHLQERAGLHCKPDSVIHEPSCFLGDTKRPVHLVAADSVLAVGDHPDRGEPLPQIDRAILKDRSDLCRELAARMPLFAFPQAAGRDKMRVCTTARRAANAVRPAQLDHGAERDIRIGEVPDGFEKGLRLVCHTNQYDSDRSLCQVYYYPSQGMNLSGPLVYPHRKW